MFVRRFQTHANKGVGKTELEISLNWFCMVCTGGVIRAEQDNCIRAPVRSWMTFPSCSTLQYMHYCSKFECYLLAVKNTQLGRHWNKHLSHIVTIEPSIWWQCTALLDGCLNLPRHLLVKLRGGWCHCLSQADKVDGMSLLLLMAGCH